MKKWRIDNGKWRIIGFLLAFSILNFPFSINAATYWVHPSGNNGACTNTTTPQGSGGNAKTTIAAGIACLAAGDTLNVRTGTYSEKVDDAFITMTNGTAGARITVMAYDGQGTATIRPPNSIGGGAAIGTRTHNYITFDGFTLDCSLLTDSQAACLYNIASFNIFQNMEIKNMGGTFGACGPGTPGGGCGEGVGAFGNDSQYINLHVHDIHLGEHDAGGNGGHGFYLHGARNVVDRCTIHDVSGQGIQVYNSGSTTESNNTVKNSIWYNTRMGATIGLSAIYIGNGTGNAVYNNVVYGSNYVGIQVGSACTNCVVYNNTVVGVTNQAFEIYAGTSGTILRNNLLSGNGNTFIDNGGSSITHDHNGCAAAGTWCDSVGSVNFTNAGANDYTLQTGSIAINNGANLGSTYSPDLANVARPTSGAWEIGAYEFGGTPPPPTCTPPSPALVASYGFEGNANDSTSVNTATLGSGWSYTTGKYGQGAVSTGLSGITVADANALDPCNGFTYEGWINLPNTSGDYAFINKNPDSKAFLFASLAGPCSGSGMPVGGYSESGGHVACYAIALPTTTFQHLAVTYDATLASANVKLYLNGIQVTTANGTDLLTATTGTLQFCTSGFGETCPSGTVVDNIHIYNYSRSAAQITTDMNTPIGVTLTAPTLKLSGIMKFGASAVALKLNQQ